MSKGAPPTDDLALEPLAAVVRSLAHRDSVRAWAQALTGSTARSGRARMPEPILPALLAAAARITGSGLLIIVDEDERAESLAEAISWYAPAAAVGAYVGRGTPWGSGVPPAALRVGRRAHARDVAAAGGIVVAAASALLERIPAADIRPEPVRLQVGSTYDRDDVVASLVAAGYRRVEQVGDRGDVAVRGDLVDVFGATDAAPHRIEFFDDEIDGIRRFSTYTQRSLGDEREIAVYPAREEPLDLEPLLVDEGVDETRDPVLEALGERLEPATDAFDSLITLTWQPLRVERAIEDADLLTQTHGVDRRGYSDRGIAEQRVARSAPLDPLDDLAPHRFEAQRPVFAAISHAEAEGELAGLLSRGLQVVLTFIHAGSMQRTVDKVGKASIQPVAGMPDSAPGTAWAAASALSGGFVSSQLELGVVPASRLFRDRSRGEAHRPGPGAAISTFTDLRPGDHIVHEDHGVGRFARFETRTVGGITRDYLYIEFAGEDRLYVPHEQIGKITRYIGADGSAPRLSKFGGKQWQHLRNRATRAVRELAGELLALYAQRARAVGMAVPPDGEMMGRFEAAFPHDETDDQQLAIDAIKDDMERPNPMDRLVCGDVGFGKTEVAMRAAAKAVIAGRQVMVLVPTTVLAQQHLASFTERFAGLPVEVDMVSRFRTKTQIEAALERFRQGKLDILVGTHRMLSRDVMPLDLGLVIVDEEQRFGVKQKELLRQLRSEVDVLAMSATPIPRTLHMSLAGLRDISVIETAPRGRRPISTFVGEYDEELIREAIQRELDRDGQVFYLHNRVQTIDEAAERLAQVVPDARILVGHGQMGERQLERVMTAFVRHEADVLVSTTIIESGLDIPQANTLIVERADVLGLSQLHQIRGRVGRSSRSAHAYLLYPSHRELTEEASARLQTLGDYSELGAGTRIAMRDLELRGAGNLLGPEQSGHVAAIGFELYVELLAEAVSELSGEHVIRHRGAQIDARIDAYIPAEYVPGEAAKVDLHRRMGLARTAADLDDLREEMTDRYGDVPGSVDNLLELGRLRLAMQELGATRLSVDTQTISVQPLDLDAADATELRTREPLATYQASRRTVTAQVPDPERQLQRAGELLRNLREAIAAPADV